MHGTHSRGRNLSDWRLPSGPVGSQRVRRWPPCTVVVSLLCSASEAFGSLCRECPPKTVPRRPPYCRGGYRRTTRVLAPGKCDVRPRSTAGTGAAGGEGAREREEEEKEVVAEEAEEEDNDGNEDGHEDDRRGPPTTRRCRARRFRRRAATCDGPVGKPTGSPCRRERVSERTSERERERTHRTHATKKERVKRDERVRASESEGDGRQETKTAFQDLVGWRYRSRRSSVAISLARLCSSGGLRVHTARRAPRFLLSPVRPFLHNFFLRPRSAFILPRSSSAVSLPFSPRNPRARSRSREQENSER